jgi:diacylglycerol kinase family enzyme
MKILAVINEGAGSVSEDNTDEEEKKMKGEFAKNNLDADVKVLPAEKIADTVKEGLKKGYNVIAAGGGDGTISNVAEIICRTDKTLAVLPAGTLNHFAKDLNIPLTTEEAIKNIAEGKPAEIDTAEVNGKIFINNSSVGFYPKTVKERDKQKFPQFAKWLSTLIASLKVFIKFPVMEVRMEVEGKKVHVRTPLVFIGNNEYDMQLFNLGARKSLEGGKLYLYYLKCETRACLVKLAFHALINRLHQADEFIFHPLNELWIESRKKRVHVALDGEVLTLESPLHYKIKPRCLKVIVPVKNNG